MDTLQLRYALLQVRSTIPLVVCPSDHLPFIHSKKFAIIVNIQDSSMDGLHWVVFFKNSNCLEFFDSLGNSANEYGKYFVQFYKRFKSFKEIPQRFQCFNSNVCGMYCLYFIVSRLHGISYEGTIRLFDVMHRRKNDEFVKKYVLQHFYFPKSDSCVDADNLTCICSSSNNNKICLQACKMCKN